MKRFFLSLLTFITAISSWAYDFEVDGIYYNFFSSKDKTVAVTTNGPQYYSGALSIPESVMYNSITYSVISIGTQAFSYCSGLTSLNIPNSVTSIGNNAFNGCTGLTSLTIPNSVTVIGDRAFYGCSGLTSLNIPNSVTVIGDYAFEGCRGLISLTIPNSVTSIGYGAFYGCSGLTSLNIPNSVTVIGNRAFYGCSGLTSLTIPNSVTWIGYDAFYGCGGLTSISVSSDNKYYDSRNDCNAIIETSTNELIRGCCKTVIPNSVTSIGSNAFVNCSSLTSLVIPSSVTSIGYDAFYGCTGLKSLTIPNSVTSIGDKTFYKCSGLTSLTIPNSVTVIGEYAFYGCSGLTSLNIPNSVTSIGYGAFYRCTGLKSLTIPNSVTSIGYDAFYGCKDLTSISVSSDNKYYDSRNDCNALIETSTNKLIRGCCKTVIPNSVTSIGNNAFDDCSSLTSLVIPNSVTSIGDYAFGDCSSLTSLVIPNSVTSIEDNAFYGCTGLTSISVSSDNKYYDSRNDCNAIIETSTNKLIRGCCKTVIPNSVTSIGDYAFSGCSSLTSLTIPNSVTSIGDHAFECTGLTSLNIPNSVTSMGDYAFQDCSGLTSLVIPNSVTSIGHSTFNGCIGLTSLVIPNSVTSIGDYAFDSCIGLTDVYNYSTTPQTLHFYTFAWCYNLKTLHVPAASVDLYKSADYWEYFENINAIAECKQGYIHTLCYNYDAIATGADFYTFTGIKDGYIYGIKVEDNKLEAGVPYLYIPTGSQIELTNLTNEITTPSNSNGMYGNFTEDFNVTGHDYKILTTTDLKYANSTSGNTVEQYSCYFKTSEIPYLDKVPSNAKVIMKITDETDGIECAQLENALVNVFTSNGVKVKANVLAIKATEGLEPGMYIINGVKTLVK